MATTYFKIYPLIQVATKLQIEAVSAWGEKPRGKLNGMYLEVNSNSYVPRGWPKEFPVRQWVQTGVAKSRIGGTDPEISSTIYLDYIGDEAHTPEGASEGIFSTFIHFTASGKTDQMGEPTNTFSRLTGYVTYDFGESWLTFFDIGEIKMWGGLTTDFMAQTMAIAATRLGVPRTGKYGRFVFDNTFMNEQNQLWLEDPDERSITKGGVGIAPIFDAPTLIVEDERERLAVHSGTWGVVRSSNKIVAATYCPVNWCQNSDGPGICPDDPLNYCVNFPKDIMWIGPAAYLRVQDLPEYHNYFSGSRGLTYLRTTVETEYGIPRTVHWYGDGVVLSGSADGLDPTFYMGWEGSEWYWAPDYRNARVNYSYPYASYFWPTGTTAIIFKQSKTEGDVPVWVDIKPGGNDAIQTGTYWDSYFVWRDTGGGWYGEYGYVEYGTRKGDPYGTSLWTFKAFKKHMLSLRPKAKDVAQHIVDDWGGIVRSIIRTPAERDYWNQRPFEFKNRDMCQLGCYIVGEYEINGRYNNMKTPLFAEFQYYSAAFDKFFVAEKEDGSIDDSGNLIFEYLPSAQNPGHYGISILPSKSFGNVIYGIKAYRERSSTLQRQQRQNYRGGPTYLYDQEQYGVVHYTPVVSGNGGITWEDVSGLTSWNHDIPRVQFKPIWIGKNQWICEHNAKLYKSFTGIGWEPLTYTPDETWTDKLNPSLDQDKTYLLGCSARNEWLAVHQYEGLPTYVGREAAERIDIRRVRTKQTSIVTVYSVYVRMDSGFEKKIEVDSVTEQTLITLKEDIPSSATEVYVSYSCKAKEARLFHVISDGAENLTHIVKDISFVGDTWSPKVDMNFQSPYDPSQGWDHALATFSGGLLRHIYYNDTAYSASSWMGIEVDPLTIVTNELPKIVSGKPYFAKIEASGGLGGYKYTGVNLPPGLSVDPETGEITGTATSLPANNTLNFVVDDSTSPAYVDPQGQPDASVNPVVYGYVMDGDGKAVANAEITLTNYITNESYTVQSDQYGRYNIPAEAGKVMRLTITKGDCTGSTTIQLQAGQVARTDGNVGTWAAGTTNIGLGVNEHPPSNQDPDSGSGSGGGNGDGASGGGGTSGGGASAEFETLDDRAPEYIGYGPKNLQVLFGENVAIKFFFAYSPENVDSDVPGAIFTSDPSSYPPDLYPSMTYGHVSAEEASAIIGTPISGQVTFGTGRKIIYVETAGTINPANNGVPYTTDTDFSIGPVYCTDFLGREAMSANASFTAKVLTQQESNGPDLDIYSPLNYTHVNEGVEVRGRTSDPSGIYSISVGGVSVPVPPGTTAMSFVATVGGFNPGGNLITVVSTDNSLRRNTTSKSVFVIAGEDNLGPALDVSAPDEGITYTFSPSFGFAGTASDSGLGSTGIQSVSVNGVVVPNARCDGDDTVSWAHECTGIALGSNTITVAAVDYAGNQTTIQRTIYRHQDGAGPEVTLDSPDNPIITSYGSYHVIRGSASDNGYGDNGVASLTMNGEPLFTPEGNPAVATGGDSVDFEKMVPLVLGVNTFDIAARDSLGNTRGFNIQITRLEP